MALTKAEQAVVAYVETATGFPTSTRVPNPRPAQFVVVARNGGPSTALEPAVPLVRVECWGTTPALAWAVLAATWPAVEGMHRADPATVPYVHVLDTDVQDPVNFPDTTSGMSRYQFLASLTLIPKE